MLQGHRGRQLRNSWKQIWKKCGRSASGTGEKNVGSSTELHLKREGTGQVKS